MPFKNPEDKKKWWNNYYKKNKQKIFNQKNKYKKEWRQTPQGIKARLIDGWKNYGLKLYGYTYDEVYEYYLETTHCEVCKIKLNTNIKTQKCMDHCHHTGCFRWVLCQSCNANDCWIDKLT